MAEFAVFDDVIWSQQLLSYFEQKALHPAVSTIFQQWVEFSSLDRRRFLFESCEQNFEPKRQSSKNKKKAKKIWTIENDDK